MDWDDFFLSLVDAAAKKSKDRSTRVGAVIVDDRNAVISLGYNGFPRGVNDNFDDRHSRPDKYKWTEHAERNAIYNAAANGFAVKGCRMYLRWYPCCDCARAIIQSGIIELIATEPDFNDPQWGEDFVIASTMLSEGGVLVRYIK